MNDTFKQFMDRADVYFMEFKEVSYHFITDAATGQITMVGDCAGAKFFQTLTKEDVTNLIENNLTSAYFREFYGSWCRHSEVYELLKGITRGEK